MTHKPLPGTRVRLTGEFLRNTGQFTGPEGFNRWRVQACDCGLCRVGPYILTDEPGFRHINYHNLEKARG